MSTIETDTIIAESGDVIVGDHNTKINLSLIFLGTPEENIETFAKMNKKVKNDNEMGKLEKCISENIGKNIEIEFIDQIPTLHKIIVTCKEIILEVREYYNQKRLLLVTVFSIVFNFSF